MPNKTCTKCLLTLPVSSFSKNSGGKYGVASRCKACKFAYYTAWCKTNRERQGGYQKRYNERNREKVLARQKRYREANPEKCRAMCLDWQKRNRPRSNALNNAYARRKVRAMPAWANEPLVRLFYDAAYLESERLGEPCEVDHIVPMKSALVCGLHNEFNLQVLTKRQNLSKHNKAWPEMPE